MLQEETASKGSTTGFRCRGIRPSSPNVSRLTRLGSVSDPGGYDVTVVDPAIACGPCQEEETDSVRYIRLQRPVEPTPK